MSEKKDYWELEEPIRAYGNRNMLTLFPKAKRLQVSSIWEEAKNPYKQGKTITLSEDDMNQEMKDTLAHFLDSIL